MFNRFNQNKCKTQAKLCIGRVRLMRNKRQIVMKQTRKEVAELLRANKQENARIRVEAVIRDQNLLQAYEVLEVFLELLSVRLQLIEKSVDIPNDMLECLASLVYAASRIQDFPELLSIRAMLGSKYKKEFIEKASSDISCRQFMVNENLIRCLAIGAPDPETKLALLSDIAQEHNVEWDTHRAHQEMIAGSGPPSSFGGGGNFGGGGYGGGGFGGGGGGGQLAPPQAPAPMFVPPPQPAAPATRAPQYGSLPAQGVAPAPAPAAAKPADDGYSNAQAAAAAAREYSQQAQSAADAAQRFASRQPTPQAGVPPAGPTQQDYPNINVPPVAGFNPMTSSLQSSTAAPLPEAPSQQPDVVVPPPATAQPRAYRQRSDEEIQAAYDAAPGPPAKADKANGPPSAPPAPQDSNSASHDGLPSPPGASSSATQKGPDGGIEADLAARFEALKKL